jgi:DNA-binding transcriptional MerR regulator
MMVSEISRLGGLTPHTVRFYVRKGLLSPERQAHNGYQVFGRHDLERVELIRALQTLGYTLAEIGKALDDVHAGRSPIPWMRSVLATRVDDVERELRVCETKRERMLAALTQWERSDDRGSAPRAFLEELAGLAGASGA